MKKNSLGCLKVVKTIEKILILQDTRTKMKKKIKISKFMRTLLKSYSMKNKKKWKKKSIDLMG